MDMEWRTVGKYGLGIISVVVVGALAYSGVVPGDVAIGFIATLLGGYGVYRRKAAN